MARSRGSANGASKGSSPHPDAAPTVQTAAARQPAVTEPSANTPPKPSDDQDDVLTVAADPSRRGVTFDVTVTAMAERNGFVHRFTPYHGRNVGLDRLHVADDLVELYTHLIATGEQTPDGVIIKVTIVKEVNRV